MFQLCQTKNWQSFFYFILVLYFPLSNSISTFYSLIYSASFAKLCHGKMFIWKNNTLKINFTNKNTEMGKLIVIEEEDLRKIIREEVAEALAQSGHSSVVHKQQNDELISSLNGICKLFKCSHPKAQKIKNSIPKELYAQHGRIFAIRKSVLLNNYNKPNVKLKNQQS
jgi:hypothetical protein